MRGLGYVRFMLAPYARTVKLFPRTEHDFPCWRAGTGGRRVRTLVCIGLKWYFFFCFFPLATACCSSFEGLSGELLLSGCTVFLVRASSAAFGLSVPFAPCLFRYSSSCELVLAVKGQGVHGFTLDSLVGEFICTKPYMRIPEVGLSVAHPRTYPIALRRVCYLACERHAYTPFFPVNVSCQRPTWKSSFQGNFCRPRPTTFP